jgi:hypothetical protein
LKARETLRSMTRGGVLPAEDAVRPHRKRLSEHDCRFIGPYGPCANQIKGDRLCGRGGPA